MPHTTEIVRLPTPTQFNPSAPTNPVRPDFISNGRLMKDVLINPAQEVISKTVKVDTNPSEVSVKNIFVYSDKEGEFVVQVLLDESDRDDNGNPVWLNLTNPNTPLAVDPGALTFFTTEILASQFRIKFTADPANIGLVKVNAIFKSV